MPKADADATKSDAGKLSIKTNPVINPSNTSPFVPVPEPSQASLVLIGAGIAGLALKLRRKA